MKNRIRSLLWLLWALLLVTGTVLIIANSVFAEQINESETNDIFDMVPELPVESQSVTIEPIAYVQTMVTDIYEDDTPIPVGIPYEEVDEPSMTYLGCYWITGYDICEQCCGKTDGITASGAQANVGQTIATGKEFSFGTKLYIDGIGDRTVEDRGVKNGCIDVLCNNHTECYAITGWYDVYIYD